jgi:hypothetical protein
MIVSFEFKDRAGRIVSANNMEKEFAVDEIQVILNSKEIAYPVNTGVLYTVKRCIIENSIYDMFTEPYKLKITLREE